MAAAAGPVIESLIGSGALSGAGEGIGAQALLSGGGGGAGGNLGTGALEKTIGKLTGLFGELDKVMSKLESPIKQMEQFFDHIANYVGKFSPATAQYFGRAVADFQAAVGEVLVPVLEFGTKIFRELGDAVASAGKPVREFFRLLVTTFEEIYQGLKPAIAAMIEVFAATVKIINIVFSALKPLIVLFSEMAILFGSSVIAFTGLVVVFGILIPLVITLTTAMFALAAPLILVLSPLIAFAAVIYGLYKLLGGGKKADFKDSAGGKAAISVGTDSVSGLLSKTQQAAFSVGGGTPEEKTASYLEELRNFFVNGVWIERLKTIARKSLPGAETAQKAGDWVQRQTKKVY